MLVLVASRSIRRPWGNHVHVFESDVDDVHARRIRARGFDVDAHDVVHVTPGQVSVTPIGLAVFGQAAGLLWIDGVFLRAIRRTGRTRTVIEQCGTARTGDATQIRARHGMVAGMLLPFLRGATGRTSVDDVCGAILDIIQHHSPGSCG